MKTAQALLAAALTALAGGACAAGIQVLAGTQESFLLKADGTLWVWGDGATRPTRIGARSDWIRFSAAPGEPFGVAGGARLAIAADGSLWAWGSNAWGQLGLGDTLDRDAPTRVGTDTDWTTVAAGYTHGLARKRNGSLWAWGGNPCGELGLGIDNMPHLEPVRVGGEEDWGRLSTTAWGCHSFALKRDGSLWEWGNVGGPLVPAPERTGDQVWTLIVPRLHTLGIQPGGTLWGWGSNSWGQAGDIADSAVVVPTRIGKREGWVRVGAGDDWSLARHGNGSLWTWGRNKQGQLGQGDLVNRPRPTRVGSDTDWAEVSAGSDHGLARKLDGSLWAWGGNAGGQLGVGDTAKRTAPTQIEAADHVALGRSPERVRLAPVPFGAPASAPVTLTNLDATRPFVIDAITARGPLSVSHGCPGALAPGASCELTLDFDTARSGGPLAGAVTIQSPSVFTGAVTIPAVGSIDAPGLDGVGHRFGQVRLGTTASHTLVLTNRGTQPLTVSEASLAGSDRFAIDSHDCVGILAPGAGCSIGLSFSPIARGLHSASVRVVSDDPATPIRDLGLVGQGVAPRLTVDLPRFDFGTVAAGATASADLTLANRGNVAMRIYSLARAGNRVYSVTHDCPPKLAPGAQCQATARFAPTDAQSYTGRLTIYTDDPGAQPRNVFLLGIGGG